MIAGILGGGQLGRMLALAGYPLGLRFRVLDHAHDACAGQVAELVVGDYGDPGALSRLASGVDFVTYDFENVPVEATRFLQRTVPVYPRPEALAVAQDRCREKALFQELDIPTPPSATVDSMSGLRAAVERIGLPAVLKTRRLGYDGKGQRVLRSAAGAEAAWAVLGRVPLLLERHVPFDREVSIVATRGRDGATVFYPLVENVHRGGILRQSAAPFEDPALTELAQGYATRLMDRLEYVGTITIEFFVAAGRLLANEMAPRVHNSGHWTIEGAETSQFENHLRAGLGMPLGSTAPRGASGMVNFIGALPGRNDVAAIPGAHFHDYGKAPRPGRKLGHGTLRADDAGALEAGLATLAALAEGAGG